MVRKTSVPRRSTGGCTELREPRNRNDDIEPQDQMSTNVSDEESGSSSGSDCSDEDLAQLASQTFKQMKTYLHDSKAHRSSSRKKKVSNIEPDIDFVVDKGRRNVGETGEPMLAVDTQTAMEPSSSTEACELSNQSIAIKKKTGNRRKRKKNKEGGGFQLSSTLQVSIDTNDTYLNLDSIEKRTHSQIEKSLIKPKIDKLMAGSVLASGTEKNDTLPPYEVSRNQQRKRRKAERDKTKGKGWFHLPATELTDEKKNDLMVLQYRRALDPKRFYKAPDIRAIPKYFQTGTVVDSPVDFYHSRIPKKQRKKTLVDELMEDAEFRKFNKRKYAEIQETNRKGRGAHKHMKRLKKKKK